jgi:hypothetical protein
MEFGENTDGTQTRTDISGHFLQMEADYDIWFAQQNCGFDGLALLMGNILTAVNLVARQGSALHPTTILVHVALHVIGFLFVCHRGVFLARREPILSSM